MALVNKFNVNGQVVDISNSDIDITANNVSYDDSFQYDENTVGDKLSELEEKIDQKANEIIGRSSLIIKKEDRISNTFISSDGTIKTSGLQTRDCVVKINVSSFRNGTVSSYFVRTGTDTRKILAFYSEDVSTDDAGPSNCIEVQNQKNNSGIASFIIPDNAVCAYLYWVDYDNDVAVELVSSEEKTDIKNIKEIADRQEKVIMDNRISSELSIKNLTENVIDNRTLVFDFEKIVREEDYSIKKSSDVLLDVVKYSDYRIGSIFKFSNVRGESVNFAPEFRFFVPYHKDYTLTFWAGMNDAMANANPYILNVMGRVPCSAATRDGVIATQIRFLLFPKNKRDSIISSIDRLGEYDLVSNGFQNRIAGSGYTEAYESISAVVDDYTSVDDVVMFHYKIKVHNVPETPYFDFGFLNASFSWAAGSRIYLGGIMMADGDMVNAGIRIVKSNIESGSNYNKVDQLQYVDSYKLYNKCIDQFDGAGTILFMKPSFDGFTKKNPHVPFKLLTRCKIEKVTNTITNPSTNETVELIGYKFVSPNGGFLPKYSGSQMSDYNDIEDIGSGKDNPIFYTECETMGESADYTMQFWVDINELNGNSFERCLNYNSIKINLQTAKKGMIGNMPVSTSELNKWKESPVLVEIVDKVENMLCIRARNIKTSQNRWSIINLSDNDVESLTIYNPTVITSDKIDPYHRYVSESEAINSQWRGKNIVLLGDSEYNNGVVCFKLASVLGANVFDMHYGGHRLSIGNNYSSSTDVSPISHSWFYQENYRKIVLGIENVEAFIMTFSTNDGSGDSDWDGNVDESKISLVEENYPTYNDIISEDKSSYNRKMSLFNAMDDTQKGRTFSFVGTYCAYIKQLLNKFPRTRLFICSVPISCTGYLTGTSVPDPSSISEYIGEWKPGQSPDTARNNLEDGFLNKDSQIRAIAKRYNAKFVDFRNECGMTYENFIYHCFDSTHWHTDVSYNCADSLMRSL